MDQATAAQLLELNRQFYEERGRDFSATRLRIQPGIRRILNRLRGNESILDIGCGNGAFALELSRAGHRGPYLGIDQSEPLLEHARTTKYAFPARFLQANILELATIGTYARDDATDASGQTSSLIEEGGWSLVTALAVLHHVPGTELRLALLHQIRKWISTDGMFVHSNWQFSTSARLNQRIQPWSSFPTSITVDTGDYLLDWRRGGTALRYVHEFSESELRALAEVSRFAVTESFYSDGADRRSGLYQVWRPA